MRYQWHIAPAQPALVSQLTEALRISPRLAQCLINRGLVDPASASAFLEPRLRQLSDPFLLPNLGPAVERLLDARQTQEPVVVFGDFDVDGITSTALLAEVLRAFGLVVKTYLPRRLEEGYGLSQEAAANCLSKFPTRLLLAVDCGSTAVHTIEWLRQQGIDVIVLDHHQISSPAPAALALVNPKWSVSVDPIERSKTPCLELSSVGLAFKLAHALIKRGRELGLPEAVQYDLRPLLDLVALGTVADLVPLTGENRVLVATGLERLSRTRRPGLQVLKQIAQIPSHVGVYEVGFQLGPRLNAAGRLENAEAALQLLLASSAEEATPLARILDAQNRERQKIERAISDEVVAALQSRFDPQNDYVIVEGQLSWHIGVVGIVASRVVKTFYRPAIILGGDGDIWRGSGRSIEGFDLALALRECHDLLDRHGGHAMAAGLTLHPQNLPALRSRLNQLARRMLRTDQLQPTLHLDAMVALGDLTLDELEDLDQLSPTGSGNPPVQWLVRRVRHQRLPQRIGREQHHVRCWVTDGRFTSEAVIWNAPVDHVPEGEFDLAFAPQINEYNGRRTVQLKVLDWRAASGS
jgi:single-stranded-DNA-specific exonuclease